MQEIMLKFAQALNGLFHSDFLSVLFISMFPVVEVRGGIPLGLTLEMSPAAAYFAAVTAGLIVVPIILILLKKVIDVLCKSKKMGKFGEALNGYFNERAQKVNDGAIVAKKDNVILKYLALYVFVAAPLPLTGFWTGSAVAVFLNLNWLKSYIVITIGNLTAGGLVLLLSLVLGENSYVITLVFLILLPVVIGLLIFKILKKRKQQKASLAAQSAPSSEEDAACETTPDND